MSIGRVAFLVVAGWLAADFARLLDAALLLAGASALARQLAFLDVWALAWLLVLSTQPETR